MSTETTGSATFTLEPDGVLCGTVTARQHTLPQARDNVVAIGRLQRGIPRPLLLDVRQVREMETEVSRYYGNPGGGVSPTALALVVHGTVNRVLANLSLAVMGLTGSRMPMRLFEDLSEARIWARGQLGRGGKAA